MTKGITLLCFAHPDYGKWAFNLALSIKRFSSLPIQLITDDKGISHLSDYTRSFFNTITEIKKEDLYEGEKLFPARAKSRIFNYLAFDYSLYLDVDAIALRSLEPLIDTYIERGGYYYTQVHSIHTIAQGEGIIEDMAWATAKTVWEHYDFDEKTELPATQSSIAFIKKCDKAESLFRRIQANLEKNPIPLDKLAFKWGGGQPDELYLNVSLAQIGLIPSIEFDPMLFSNRYINNLPEFAKSYYLMGIYGAQGMTHNSLIDYYDRLMHNFCREHFKINHLYKAHQLIKNKFAGKK